MTITSLPKASTLESIAFWFQLAVPSPTTANQRVQLGCHMEEVGEMLEIVAEPQAAITVSVLEAADELKKGVGEPQYLHQLSAAQRADLLDALCDQVVTAIGVAHMYRLDIIGALSAVDDANWRKFINGLPQFDANGKIKKPEGWEPANVAPFIHGIAK